MLKTNLLTSLSKPLNYFFFYIFDVERITIHDGFAWATEQEILFGFDGIKSKYLIILLN